MEILSSTPRQEFKEQLDALLENMESSVDNGTISQDVDAYQKGLDDLAIRFQKDAKIGPLRYKLYEAQAYLHYFRGDKEKALRFINEAVKVRGEEFPDAIAFKKKLQSEDQPAEPIDDVGSTQTLPIDGWLGFFVFGISIGVLFNIYEAIANWNNISLLTPAINAAYPNLGTLVVFEELAFVAFALTGVLVVYLIFQRKRVAREIGILFLVTVVLWAFVDYMVATTMFADNSDALKAIQSSSSTGFVIPSILWTVYLIRSKQVKRTLSR